MTRHLWELLHRWVGLTIAGFLFVSGLTGAIISWDHELDEALNGDLVYVDSQGSPHSPFDLARQIELRDAEVEVTFIPLSAEPGKALVFGVDPRIDPATGDLFEPGYNEVFIDPMTGAEIGRRDWGAVWPISRQNVISFLYVLHYSLHIPAMWGIDHWGKWLLGCVAILWTIDCFVGFYLTLPLRHARRGDRPAAVARQLSRSWLSRWAPAWKIKLSGSAYRINFDVHRAASLWTWAILFMLAFTSLALNLYEELFYPVVSQVSETTPTPFDVREPTAPNDPIVPKIGFREILARATADATAQGWSAPPGYLFYARDYGVYAVAFYHPGDDHGVAGGGSPQLYYDAIDGRYLGNWRPWEGTAADLFVQAQFPLHSGRILGIPGRILVSVMGLVVAALSVTGVVIWWRKRVARQRRARMH
jgi:uncharacterized iron-regulated membrane protein